MHSRLRLAWTIFAIVMPIGTGVAWICVDHPIVGAVGVVVGVANAALLIRRSMPIRIPSFVPAHKRKPIEVQKLRYPGNG